jgi:hypothetical protein
VPQQTGLRSTEAELDTDRNESSREAVGACYLCPNVISFTYRGFVGFSNLTMIGKAYTFMTFIRSEHDGPGIATTYT